MNQTNPLLDRYADVLTSSLGIECGHGQHGLMFEWNGLPVLLPDHGPNDPSYFEVAVMMPVADFDQAQLAPAVNNTNGACKGATVFWGAESLVIEIRSLVSPPGVLPTREHIAAVLPRALGMLGHACWRLGEELKFEQIARSADASGWPSRDRRR